MAVEVTAAAEPDDEHRAAAAGRHAPVGVAVVAAVGRRQTQVRAVAVECPGLTVVAGEENRSIAPGQPVAHTRHRVGQRRPSDRLAHVGIGGDHRVEAIDGQQRQADRSTDPRAGCHRAGQGQPPCPRPAALDRHGSGRQQQRQQTGEVVGLSPVAMKSTASSTQVQPRKR